MHSGDGTEAADVQRWIGRCVATLVFAALTASPAVAREIMVGTGTPESCTESALQLGLLTAGEERGGVIHFDCGAAPASISVAGLLPGEARAARLVVPDHTTIDGNNLITFDGLREDGILLMIPAGANAELRGMTIRGGPFGITVYNLGTLEVDHCTVADNEWSGIYNRLGNLRVRHSHFLRNGTFAGGNGAIFNFKGDLLVEHTSFADNLSDAGGAAVINSGTATVRGSTFASNVGHWIGGAFLNARNAEAVIENSEFAGNVDMVDGGAVSNAGRMTVRNSWFHNNATDRFGGGLYLEASSVTMLSNSVVSGNYAQRGGGIYLAPGASPPTMIRTTISGNVPDDVEPDSP